MIYRATTFALIFFLVFSISTFCYSNNNADIPAPVFKIPESNNSSSGNLKILWKVDKKKIKSDKIKYELQQSSDEHFSAAKKIYEGADRATYISGLRNGIYYYRVRAFIDGQFGDWSKPASLKVKHHSLKLALILFFVGAMVFTATAWLVIRGSAKEDNI